MRGEASKFREGVPAAPEMGGPLRGMRFGFGEDRVELLAAAVEFVEQPGVGGLERLPAEKILPLAAVAVINLPEVRAQKGGEDAGGDEEFGSELHSNRGWGLN